MKLSILCLSLLLCSGNACEKYNRTKHFGGWKDTDKDGQDTRVEVLIEESKSAVNFRDAKETKISSGYWHCPYSNKDFNTPDSLDIDHLVPLKEVYESGGWKWSKDRRIGYANYLARKNHLIAVYNKENRSKGDQDPAEWLPSNSSYRKQYVRDWCDVKARWGLTADSSEARKIKEILGPQSAKVWLKNVAIAPEDNCAD